MGVNAVSPGPTRAEGMADYAEMPEKTAARAPAHRARTSQEVANAIVFLASSAASLIDGVVLPVDGGRPAV